ncbi:hypothetical protein Efla_005169 [Eimeria flavescens]
MSVPRFFLASFLMLLNPASAGHGANARSLEAFNAIMATPANAQHGFINSSAASMNEQPEASSLQWQGRTALRRGSPFLRTTIVAVASTLAVVAMAFLVLQCFKALGKSYSEVYRRLGDNPGFEGDDDPSSCILRRTQQSGSCKSSGPNSSAPQPSVFSPSTPTAAFSALGCLRRPLRWYLD